MLDISDRKFGTLLELEKRYVFRNMKKKGRIQPIPKLPTASEFKTAFRLLLQKGEKYLAASLILMLGSGRRHIDLTRVRKNCFDSRGVGIYFLIIPKDKTNSNLIRFESNLNFIPSSWLPSSRYNLHIWIMKLVQKGSDYPFDQDLNSNLSRNIKFKIHGIRSVAAVYLKVKGYSNSEIMNRIGWMEESMISRYCRVCLTGKIPETLCLAIAEINSNLDKIYKV